MPDPEPINGSQNLPDMSPAERMMWLASHNAPKGYMLLTVVEMMAMRNNMLQASQLANELSAEHASCLPILAEHWNTEPNFINAVAAAAFDAERYKKAVDLVLPKLKKLQVKLDALLIANLDMVVRGEIHTIATVMASEIKMLEKQANLRRKRIPVT